MRIKIFASIIIISFSLASFIFGSFIRVEVESQDQNKLKNDLENSINQTIVDNSYPLDLIGLDMQIDSSEAEVIFNFTESSESFLKAGGSAEFLDEADILFSQLILDQGIQVDSYVYKLQVDGLPLFQPERSEDREISDVSLFTQGPDDFDVVLSPGHGYYYDSWQNRWKLQRVYYNGIVEDFINHDIITELGQRIDDSVAQVYYTREMNRSAAKHTKGYPMWQMSSREYLKERGDVPENVWNSYNGSAYESNIADDIRARPLYANYVEGDVLINLHNNGGGGCGTETWYDTYNGYGGKSKELAKLVQSKLIQKIRAEWNSGWCDRGIKSSDGGYGENREFNGPAVLIELGFMDNPSDNNALQQKRFRDIANQAIKEAVLEFRNNHFDGVEITKPTHLTNLTEVSSFDIEAEVVVPQSSDVVEKVRFFDSGKFIGEDSDEPYSISIDNPDLGIYYLTAKADLKSGVELDSNNTVKLTINFPFNPWVSDIKGFTKMPYEMVEFKDKLYQSHTGNNNRIYTRYTSSTDVYSNPNSGWTGWKSSEDPREYSPLPVTMATFDGKIYHTHIGRTDGEGRKKIYTRSSEDGIEWTGWSKGPDPKENTPLPIDMVEFDNKLYQVHVGGNNKIYTRYLEKGSTEWSPWDRDKGDPNEFTSHPVRMAVFEDKLYQVHAGKNKKIYTRHLNKGSGEWSNWERDKENKNEYANTMVDIHSVGGKIYQVHNGRNKKIYTRVSSDGKDWSDWLQNEGDTNLPVTLTDFEDHLYQAYVNYSERMYWRKLG